MSNLIANIHQLSDVQNYWNICHFFRARKLGKFRFFIHQDHVNKNLKNESEYNFTYNTLLVHLIKQEGQLALNRSPEFYLKLIYRYLVTPGEGQFLAPGA